MNFSFVKKLSKSILVLVILFATCTAFYQMRIMDRKMKKNLKLTYMLSNPCKNGSFLLENVPNAEDTKLVVKKKNIEVRRLNTIYNSSIINYKDHYLMAFRYDDYRRDAPNGYFSKIGFVELDKNFEQMEKEYRLLDCDDAEDPRLLSHEDKIYVVFNSGAEKNFFNRKIHIAEIDYNDFQTKEIQCLDLKLNPVEKNWSPFIYNEEKVGPKIYFEYDIPKRKILELQSKGIKVIQEGKNYIPNLKWDWGKIRGGTQAIKIDDHYLAFFHSSFDDKLTGKKFYVTGAYTFDEKPPFKVTRISYYPILFEGVYTSAHKAYSSPLLRCIYPAGIATETIDGKLYLHISCGENDSSTKIITIDKDVLYKSLRCIN